MCVSGKLNRLSLAQCFVSEEKEEEEKRETARKITSCSRFGQKKRQTTCPASAGDFFPRLDAEQQLLLHLWDREEDRDDDDDDNMRKESEN